MNTAADSKAVRRLAHKILDDLLDTAEALLEYLGEEWAEELKLLRAGSAKPQITPAEKLPEPQRAKPMPCRPGKGMAPRGEVIVGCTRRKAGKELVVVLTLSPVLADRIGLGPTYPSGCDVSMIGRDLVLGPGERSRVWRCGNGHRLLVHLGSKRGFKATEAHRSEPCAHHLDLQNRLVIQMPSWVSMAAGKRPVMISESRVGPRKAKGPPAMCSKVKPVAGLVCSICGKPAMVECSRCHKLVCNACWEPHVRTHWHADAKGAAGAAAAEAKRAMRGET